MCLWHKNQETPIYFLFVFILRHSLFTTSSWHKIDRAIVSECNKIGSTHPIKHHDVSFSFEEGRRGEREGEVRERKGSLMTSSLGPVIENIIELPVKYTPPLC